MNKKITNVTIGADPELFIINEKTGKVVSSIGMIPGEKGEPYVDESMAEGFGLETDNILAEFNIPPARKCADFVNSIEFMKSYIDQFVKKINPELGIKCAASELVDEDQLQSDEAKMFGCSVDFNAYTESENPKPKGDQTNLRSAGFHIHCGYDNQNVEQSVDLIKMFDLYLGLPSIIKDRDERRRTLYGKAGCFRLTSYGCEYRVLSSAMMATPELTEFFYNQTMKAIDAYNNGKIELTNELQQEVEKVINSGDVEGAKKIINQFNIL